jgi:hypothetical protein
MTEDILFDNIYVGHSLEDARALAAESFDVKKSLEKAADKAADPEDEDDSAPSFKEDPVNFLRTKAFDFIEIAKEDPVAAFKSQPETGAALAAALFTFLGMIGALFGLVGSAQKPVVTSVSKLILVKLPHSDESFSQLRSLHPRQLHLWHLLVRVKRRKRQKKTVVPRNVLASKLFVPSTTGTSLVV